MNEVTHNHIDRAHLGWSCDCCKSDREAAKVGDGASVVAFGQRRSSEDRGKLRARLMRTSRHLTHGARDATSDEVTKVRPTRAIWVIASASKGSISSLAHACNGKLMAEEHD